MTTCLWRIRKLRQDHPQRTGASYLDYVLMKCRNFLQCVSIHLLATCRMPNMVCFRYWYVHFLNILGDWKWNRCTSSCVWRWLHNPYPGIPVNNIMSLRCCSDIVLWDCCLVTIVLSTYVRWIEILIGQLLEPNWIKILQRNSNKHLDTTVRG
jgi:hypothetical protein